MNLQGSGRFPQEYGRTGPRGAVSPVPTNAADFACRCTLQLCVHERVHLDTCRWMCVCSSGCVGPRTVHVYDCVGVCMRGYVWVYGQPCALFLCVWALAYMQEHACVPTRMCTCNPGLLRLVFWPQEWPNHMEAEDPIMPQTGTSVSRSMSSLCLC